jgi:hypothetical protein
MVFYFHRCIGNIRPISISRMDDNKLTSIWKYKYKYKCKSEDPNPNPNPNSNPRPATPLSVNLGPQQTLRHGLPTCTRHI